MSIAQTFTVTVVSTGSGNKYVIDGVQQDTVMIGAGLTYKFDQSDSSNGTHPLRFATAADAAGGSQYTIGVTAVGTPGNSGAYTEIQVQNGAPSTLYYYCTNHGGMGGEANTDGWGRSYYGQADWGDTNVVVQGWGRLGWGAQAYGDAPVVTLGGLQAIATIGSLSESIIVQPGWGTLDYGENGWGSVESAIENLIAPSALTSSVGDVLPEDVVGLTGVSATASTVVQLDIPEQLQGIAATVSEGQIDINDGADQTVGLASLVGTTAVGAISPADVMGVTGVGANTGVGDISIDSIDIINVSGVSATASVGTLDPIPMTVGLSGISATTNVGAIAPTEMTVGLTGQEATASVGSFSIIALGDIDISGNTSYNGVDVTGNTSYTDVEHVA